MGNNMPIANSLSLKTTVLAIMLISSISVAQAQVIIGGPDCGTWFKRKDRSSIWLAGFVSGVNSLATKETDALAKMRSADQLYLWMDNYCKANPLNDVVSGALELYLELQNKK